MSSQSGGEEEEEEIALSGLGCIEEEEGPSLHSGSRSQSHIHQGEGVCMCIPLGCCGEMYDGIRGHTSTLHFINMRNKTWYLSQCSSKELEADFLHNHVK